MRDVRIYGLVDPRTGETVFQGTGAECAAFCGGSFAGFYGREDKTKNGTYHGYRVELIYDDPVGARIGTREKEAAAAWDAFCEPIRREFGIRVKGSE